MGKKAIIFAIAATLTLGVCGCAQTTNAQTINMNQPQWGADNYQNGMIAWERKDYKNAARFFKDAYGFNNARAEAMLGILYIKGAGVFQSAEVARGYAIATDQRPAFDAFAFYHKQWESTQDPDLAYLIAWILANRFSGQAKQDYDKWITLAAQGGQADAAHEVQIYLN